MPINHKLRLPLIWLAVLGPLLLGAHHYMQPLSNMVASAFASDDFNSCSLDSEWVYTNPLGLGIFELTGGGSGEAYVTLGVPSGTTHDAWAPGLIQNPRIARAIADTNFTVEIKFNQVPDVPFVEQGLLLFQDGANFARLSFFTIQGTMRAFVGDRVNGTSSVLNNANIPDSTAHLLRVTRLGDTLTFEHSFDGAVWDTAYSFQTGHSYDSLMVFVGNPVQGNAYTTEVDYVFNAAAPIMNEDGILNTLTVNTIGTGTGTVSVSPNQATYACGDTLILTATANPGSTFDGYSGDLVGTNAVDTIVVSGPLTVSATFTSTTAVTPAFASDDFNGCELDSVWIYIDPLGDGGIALLGGGSGDAQLSLSVPGGTPHDSWGMGGVNQNPRVMQTAIDTAFDLVVKFDSEQTLPLQFQEILVEQDSSNFLRFSTFQTPSGDLRVFAGFRIGGTNAIVSNVTINSGEGAYLRVRRDTSSYIFDHSADGITWLNVDTFLVASLVVNQVGLAVGNPNASFASPNTMLVDYFFNQASPILPEDGETFSLGLVVNGPGSVSIAPNQPTYACGDTLILTATPDSGAMFVGYSGALMGTTAVDTFLFNGNAQITADFMEVQTCELTDAGLDDIACNDNGTPTDPSDDYITFTLNPTGDFLGSSYQVSGDLSVNGLSYGAPAAFQSAPGTAGAGALTLTIQDTDSAGCTLALTVADPGTCSDAGFLVLSADTVTGTVDTPTTVSVTVRGMIEVLRGQGSISWDTQVAELDTAIAAVEGFAYTLSGTDGLTFSIEDASNLGYTLSDGDTLIQLVFNVLTNAQDSTVIRIDGSLDSLSFTDPRGAMVVETHDGLLRTDSMSTRIVEVNAVRSLSAYPNPFQDQLTLMIHAEHHGEAQFNLLDVQGRSLFRTLIPLHAGQQVWTWKALGRNGQKLPAGVYHAQFVLNGEVFTLRLLKQ